MEPINLGRDWLILGSRDPLNLWLHLLNLRQLGYCALLYLSPDGSWTKWLLHWRLAADPHLFRWWDLLASLLSVGRNSTPLHESVKTWNLLKLATRGKGQETNWIGHFVIATQVNIRRPCSTATQPAQYTARRVRCSSRLSWWSVG